MGAESLVDFASLDTAASAVETPAIDSAVEAPVVDSGVETPAAEVDSTLTEGKETETTNADGSEKSDEEKATFKTAAAKAESDKAIDTKATPENVRKGLKAFPMQTPLRMVRLLRNFMARTSGSMRTRRSFLPFKPQKRPKHSSSQSVEKKATPS